MKRTLLSLSLLAALACAAAPAQTSTTATVPTLKGALDRLGGTFLFDSAKRGAPTYAVTYETSRLTNVLGRRFDLSLVGILGTSAGSTTLGFGALYTRDVRLAVSDELRGSLSLTVGPAALYNASGRGFHAGLVAGVGFRF